MDAGDQGASRLVPLSTLGVMLAAMMSVWLSQSSLDTARHAEPRTFRRTIDGHEGIPARLWQDPLQAVHDGFAAETDMFGASSSTARSLLLPDGLETSIVFDTIRGLLPTGASAPASDPAAEEPPALLVLSVLVDGRPGSEASETRRRRRHAVLSGLGVHGYVPDEPDHLGAFYADRVFNKRKIVQQSAQDDPFGFGARDQDEEKLIPFEWLGRDTLVPPPAHQVTPLDGPARVLVLWVDEAYLSSQPLADLEAFHQALLMKTAVHLAKVFPEPAVRDDSADDAAVVQRWEQELWRHVSLRVLGPSGSTTLLRMMQELARPPVSPRFAQSELQSLIEVARRYLDFGLPQEQLTPQDKAELEAPLTALKSAPRRNGFALRQGVPLPEELHDDLVDALVAMQAQADPAGQPISENYRKDLGELIGQAVVDWYEVWISRLNLWGQQPSSLGAASELVGELEALGLIDEEDRFASISRVRDTLFAADSAVALRIAQLRRLAQALRGVFPDVVDSATDWSWGVALAWEADPGSSRVGDGVQTVSIERSRLAQQIILLNARATVPWELSAQRAEIAAWCRDNGDVQGLFEQEGRPHLYSAVAQDHHLALAIVLELERRGVQLYGDQVEADHVALLSEWDTLYGRSLATIMEAAVRYRARFRGEPVPGQHRITCTADPDHSWPACWDEHLVACLTPPAAADSALDPARRIHRVSYLRGLDGRLPGDSFQDTGSEPRRAPDEPSSQVLEADSLLGIGGLREHAAGRNQYDQVRRVANQLRNLDHLLADDRDLNFERGRIRAIGVLGSDFYDKQLVLNALKPDFPHAVFFTTDLDARFLHHEEFDSNRNLIVASAFGLELSRRHQLTVAPFRHAYQSSEFLATRMALWRHPTASPLWDLVAGSMAMPRLFEIGRKGMVDITPASSGANGAPIHPGRGHLAPRWTTIGKLLLLSGLAGVLVVSLSRKLRANVRRDWRSVAVFAAVFVLLVLVFMLLIDVDTRDGEGEPFALWEGVSIWPTELLRCLVALLSCGFLVIAVKSIRLSDQRLTERYGLQRAAGMAAAHRARWLHHGKCSRGSLALGEHLRRLVRRRRSISISVWSAFVDKRAGEQDRVVSLDFAWARYLYLGRSSHRFIRLVPLALTYILVGLLLITVLGTPHVPFRGRIALVVDKLVLFSSVASLTALIFFVVDATRLCAQFVRTLGAGSSSWKDIARARWLSQQRGLKLDDMRGYLDIEIIAARTELIGRLIVLPFVVLLLMIVSRHEVFDAWDWPPSLVLIFAAMAAMAIVSGITLRRVAERVRGKVLLHMRHRLSKMQTAANANRRARYEMLIEDIVALRRGAFASLAGSPVLGAVLIPFGGVSTITLIEALARG